MHNKPRTLTSIKITLKITYMFQKTLITLIIEIRLKHLKPGCTFVMNSTFWVKLAVPQKINRTQKPDEIQNKRN